MPKELKEKIDNTEEAVESATKLMWSIGIFLLKAIFVFSVIAGAAVWVWSNRELLAKEVISKATEIEIHEEVVKQTSNIHLSKSDSLLIVQLERDIKDNRRLILAERNNHDGKLSTAFDMIQNIQTEDDYQAKIISNLVEALSEEMDLKTGCPFPYYETNGGSKWIIKEKDSYETNAVYPIEIKSERCKAYYIDAHTGTRLKVR